MKKFIAYIAAFSAMVVAILIACEVYVEHVPNPYRHKHLWMTDHSADVSTLLLGNSHIYYGVIPSELGDSAFSLANVSQTYRYDYYLLRHYPMPHLRNVVLPLSYASLWEDFEAQQVTHHIIYYRLYMDCDIHPRMGRYGAELCHAPSMRQKLKSLYTPRQMYWDERGWGLEYTLENRASEWENGRERAELNTYTDTTLVRLNEALLDSIAIYCESRGARLILVRPPVNITYRQATSRRQVMTNDRILARFMERHPGTHLLDMRADTCFTEQDFYDADHLNHSGAHRLTALIRHHLQ